MGEYFPARRPGRPLARRCVGWGWGWVNASLAATLQASQCTVGGLPWASTRGLQPRSGSPNTRCRHPLPTHRLAAGARRGGAGPRPQLHGAYDAGPYSRICLAIVIGALSIRGNRRPWPMRRRWDAWDAGSGSRQPLGRGERGMRRGSPVWENYGLRVTSQWTMAPRLMSRARRAGVQPRGALNFPSGPYKSK